MLPAATVGVSPVLISTTNAPADIKTQEKKPEGNKLILYSSLEEEPHKMNWLLLMLLFVSERFPNRLQEKKVLKGTQKGILCGEEPVGGV